MTALLTPRAALPARLRIRNLTAASAVTLCLLTAKNLKTFLVRLLRTAGIITAWKRRLKQSPDGRFAAELSLDAVERTLTGNVDFIYGNLRSILKWHAWNLILTGWQTAT